MLVDAITEHEPGRRLVAVKNVTVNEEFFQGHFPGAPTLPGVLMLESLSQVAAILLLQREGAPPDSRDLSARRERREVPASGRAGRPAAARDLARPPAHVAGARAGDRVRRRSDRRRSRAAARPRARRHRDRSDGHRPPDARRSAPAPTIGPHAVIGAHVRIGANCRIGASAVIDGWTEIGDGHGNLSVRVDRPDPAGPEVPGRGDAAGRSAAATSSASSSPSIAARAAAAA